LGNLTNVAGIDVESLDVVRNNFFANNYNYLFMKKSDAEFFEMFFWVFVGGLIWGSIIGTITTRIYLTILTN
jgi:hypothetical protein